MPLSKATSFNTETAANPLPRPPRGRRRGRLDRGLPADEELKMLAAEYLRRQRTHWPQMAAAGLLPEPTDEVTSAMAEDFKKRHRGAASEPARLLPFFTYSRVLGGSYCRFSSDNSSPNSISDQLVKSLDKAKAENVFVPWAFVYADYAVSGLDNSRLGYVSYKQALRTHDSLKVTFIDDFTRASRDSLEWWKLASFHKKLRKGMLGASDGFDLNSPDWDLKMTIFSLLSRLFIQSLQQKVKRGMSGSARRGTVLGKLSLGFTKQELKTADGHTVLRANGLPKHVPCICPITAPSRLRMFQLYMIDGLSVRKIRKIFNAESIDGWNGWTDTAIRKLLWSATAVGIFIYNQERREFDVEEERWVKLKNPPAEWEVHYDPKLRIVPLELWKKARRKLAKSRRSNPSTGKRYSRNELSPTTLFSGLLFCDDCEREMLLNRSAGPHKSFACPNGVKGVHGCKACTSKSSRIIESCLLAFVKDRVLTSENLSNVLTKANSQLKELAQRPKVKTAPIRSKAKALETQIGVLVKRVASAENDELRESYDRGIATLQSELRETRARLVAAESQNGDRPRQLNLQHISRYVEDLRGTMNDASIPAAAAAIRRLLGEIRIRQEVEPGKRGGRWMAIFKPNVVAALAGIAGEKKYPDRIALEFLSSHNWITSEPVEILLEIPNDAEKRVKANRRTPAPKAPRVNRRAALRHEAIGKCLRDGLPAMQVAKKLGVGKSTVFRVQQRMRAEEKLKSLSIAT